MNYIEICAEENITKQGDQNVEDALLIGDECTPDMTDSFKADALNIKPG